MSKNIPTGNSEVLGGESQKLKMILRSRKHGSQTDISNKHYGNGSTSKKLILDLESKEENMRNQIVDMNKWEKEQQKLGFPSASVVDEYHQKLRSAKGILEKIHIELSNSEIEEDLIMITGQPPSPKLIKRPNVIQNRLNTFFPGSSFANVTSDSYNVREFAEPHSTKTKTKKRKNNIWGWIDE